MMAKTTTTTMALLALATIAAFLTTTPVHGQDYGNGKFGCYHMTSHACECGPEVCTKESCEGKDPGKYLFTEGCTSCFCANSAELEAAVEEEEGEEETAAEDGDEHDGLQDEEEEDGGAGEAAEEEEEEDSYSSSTGAFLFGCYRLEDHTCHCTPDVCSEELCTGRGAQEGHQYFWTDGCDCTCGAPAGGIDGVAAEDRQEGFGCYHEKVHECDCSPSACSKAACESKSKFHAWTDECSSCQCSEEEIEELEEIEENQAEEAENDEEDDGDDVKEEETEGPHGSKPFPAADLPASHVIGAALVSIAAISVLLFMARKILLCRRGTAIADAEKDASKGYCVDDAATDSDSEIL